MTTQHEAKHEAKTSPAADTLNARQLGTAVANLVENVVDNALRLAEEVTRDASRIAHAARDFLRSLQNA